MNSEGYNLELKEEGGGDYRHHLNGIPVHAGDTLELYIEGEWYCGKYDWIFNLDFPPVLNLDGTVELLAHKSVLRWPE